jgi:hypothetical protein
MYAGYTGRITVLQTIFFPVATAPLDTESWMK